MKQKIKINLGCGVHLHKGFINVDNAFTFKEITQKEGIFENAVIEKDAQYVKTDLLEKLPFKDNYADYIVMVDVIEHFPMNRVASVLSEVYRILKPSGQFIMMTTDFYDVILSWLDMVNRGEDFEEFVKRSQVVYGNQVHGGEFHKTPFTPKFINICMQNAGFENYKLTKYFRGSLCVKIDGDVHKKGLVYINNMLHVDATK